MSVNTANTPDGNGVLIFNGEVILVFAQGVVLTMAANQNQGFDGKLNGTIYLTSHRIIFMPVPAGQKGIFSFEMPFSCVQDVTLEQPIFGANYLKGLMLAPHNSNLRGQVHWRLTFNKGGCIDFGRALIEAVDRASRFRPASAPPAYAPPAGSFYAAPPAYYGMNNGNHNGFTPPPVFNDRPDPNQVFMTEAPPPYSGIGPDREPQPTSELRRAGETGAPPAYDSSSTANNIRRRN